MKNTYVLPTDKPSRLHLWTDENGTRPALCELEYSHTRNTQHIYITSDEYIGLSYYLDGNLIRKGVVDDKDYWEVRKDYKKIILTTDQDLIKDGVQAIPDEFLEWFVKNPSCEEVEVLKQGVKTKRNQWGFTWKYFIKIPKEEPKKVGEYQQELFSYLHDLGITALQSEMQEIERIVLNMQQELERGITITHIDKQETLEEAKKYAELSYYGDEVDAFVRGVKWQQEQDKNKYSEEEVVTILDSYNKYLKGVTKEQSLEQWFEQFKKK